MRAEIKIVPPTPGRSPFFRIRGTYLGHYVDRSAKTGDRATAKKVLAKIREQIERGEFARPTGPTFAAAAVKYMNSGGERRFMAPLLIELGSKPLADIDEDEIERVAEKLYAGRTPATRNRQVYTPVLAVLRSAKISIVVDRPEGANGTPRQRWMKPETAMAYLQAAWRRHTRFAAYMTFLLYTGCRLSEGTRLQIEDLHLEESFAFIGVTKNGEPRPVHLPPIVVQAIRLALLEPGNATYKRPDGPRTEGSVFCLTKSGALYDLFREVEKLAGIDLPKGVAFHLSRHTYGAWMRRYGGIQRLEETGAWSSRGGASTYDHYDVTAAARAADLFPGATGAPKIRSA